MTDAATNNVNGFIRGEDGKLRLNGKLVNNGIAEQAASGAILANFDMSALKAKKARKAASGTADMVSALRDISPAIELLKVGMTAKIPMPKKVEGDKDPKRSFVMSIVTKINSVTQKGREWSGRVFDSLSDEEGDFFYVSRLPDTDNPHVRATGGGRKAGSGAKDSLAAALEASRAHLAGGQPAKVEEQGEGEMVIVPDTETKANEQVMEDATVIKH